MKELTELQKQILKQEFPQISFSDDLDVERYFELRKNGFLGEALYLYNGKLKRKYPDDKMRFELLSSYRKRSSRFQELLTENLIELADTTIFKIKQIIHAITSRIAKLNMNDVYSVVQQCELVVSAISKDRFVAISFTEKYARYANILNYKAKDMKKSADIIRMYVTDALSSVREYKEEQADIALQKKRKAREYKPKSVFDFSKIIFTKEQKDAIVISENIKNTEDQVVAYTLKYWNVYSNSAFENAVLLYSRKYKTKHFNIFQAVKIGRYRSWKDEEILHAVLANVVNGYYYSISGDLYLQRQWTKAKASIQLEEKKRLLEQMAKEAEKEKQQEEQESKKKTKSKSKSKSKDKDKVKTKVKAKSESESKAETKNQSNLKDLSKKSKIERTEGKLKQNKITQDEAKQKTKNTIEKSKFKTEKSKINKERNITKTTSNFESAKNKINSVNVEASNTMSISEIVMNLTGSRYKIHKGIFFVTIRKSIRKELNRQNIASRSVFNDEKNNAEDLIYNFFEENYDNPFQNWLKSKQHAELEKLGFEINEIESIIQDWAKNGRK